MLLRPSNHGEQVIYQLPLQPARGGPARHIHLLLDRCEGWRVTAGGANDRSVRVEAVPKRNGYCRHRVCGWIEPQRDLAVKSARDPDHAASVFALLSNSANSGLGRRHAPDGGVPSPRCDLGHQESLGRVGPFGSAAGDAAGPREQQQRPVRRAGHLASPRAGAPGGAARSRASLSSTRAAVDVTVER